MTGKGTVSGLAGLSAKDLLAREVEIRSPTALYDIAELLGKAIDQGLICQTDGEVRLEDLSRDASFPSDVIRMRFVTIPGGTMYELSCETYHGVGGYFRRI